MAGRSAHVRRISSDFRGPERRRSSSHGDATPRVPAPTTLVGHLLHPHDHTVPPSPMRSPSPSPAPSVQNATPQGAPTADHGPKRLGFLGDILQLPSAGHLPSASHLHSHAHSSHLAPSPASVASSAQRSGTTPIPSSLLPARSHSRADSALPRDPREGAHSPVPLQSMASPANQPNKGHTSPSKASSTRTYDSKLVSREMHRLGNLAHLPSLAPAISAPQSTITLNMPPSAAPNISAALATESPWASLHVLILPLFNNEPLRCPIEDLNQLVRRHIQTVVAAAPGRAVATLESDTYELIAAGMVTLDSRLSGVEDDKLIMRIVELWTFFWTQVLPYLEGALLPLQTDPILSSLYRTPKAHRPTSPTSTQNGKGASASLLQSATQIDVRSLALVSFRDRIILPLFPRLHARLTMSKDENMLGSEVNQARLQQMLLVLVSQRSQRLASLSLTAPPPQPTAGEAAITRLLRALHAPLATIAPRHMRSTAAPSFLSAGLPRDRRGRIAQKADLSVGAGTGAGEGETDTPRVGVTFADPGRERDKELLESLRSPDPESSTRMSMGGWGLGGGKEEEHSAEDEDDENMDWDQAQEMVEQLVGLGLRPATESGSGSASTAQQEPRRRAQPPVEGYKV
ncbi:HbrB-domain-containing protein [Lentinus tigrinus ALCF2SS1-6]|uniref:HbrB-domain-containing protein n=1 Tax=Lentinus tigrinus ALCF2SS1-6 TaxID=1328759 RepID=A0A5C2RUJ6_9APHY|nr:HbrB-domain-containing protein [Lentinus tigrinus ALCF2SS1-6]